MVDLEKTLEVLVNAQTDTLLALTEVYGAIGLIAAVAQPLKSARTEKAFASIDSAVAKLETRLGRIRTQLERIIPAT
jgi:hypothetical protein